MRFFSHKHTQNLHYYLKFCGLPSRHQLMEFTASTHSYLLWLPTAQARTIFDVTQIQMEARIGRFGAFSCMHSHQIDEYLICEWIALERNKIADKVSVCVYIVNHLFELIRITNWDLRNFNVRFCTNPLTHNDHAIFKNIQVLAKATKNSCFRHTVLVSVRQN